MVDLHIENIPQRVYNEDTIKGAETQQTAERKEKKMTYGQALKNYGVNVEKEEFGTDAYGTTKLGKRFSMRRAGGAYGMKFTVVIDGQIKATACVFRTALKLIKTN